MNRTNPRSKTIRTIDGVEYAPGAKFRVVREGARMSGMKPIPGGMQGWRRDLEVGEIVECDGFGPGWGSDPGYGIHWREPGVNFVTIRPEEGGIWNYHPAPGYLEPVSNEEQA